MQNLDNIHLLTIKCIYVQMFLKQRMQEIYDKKIPKDINMQIYCLCKCFCVKKYVSYVNGLSWSDKDCTTNRIWVAFPSLISRIDGR